MRAMLASTQRRGEGGPLSSLMAVSAGPRRWTPGEIILVEEVAERTWAAMERVRGEAALRHSEGRYRTLFDSIDEGFCVVEVLLDEAGGAADYRFLEINPAFERQTGLIDAVGRTMRSLAAGHEDFWFETFGRIARTRRPERFEHEAKALGRWYDVYAFPVGDPELRQVAILFQDVQENRRAQAALRESEERFRSFADNSADVLWIADNRGRLEYLSAAFAMMFGESRESAMSNPGRWRELVHPDDREAADTAMPRTLGGVVTQIEYRVTRPSDGVVRWVQDTGFPIRDEAGEVVRVAGVTQDVTDRRAMEDRQRVLLGELQHRVRNILGVVRSIARRGSTEGVSAADYLAHLDGRIDALARVQTVLTRAPHRGVDLRSMVDDQIAAHHADGGQISVDGPDVALHGRTAESFALAIHELAVNALKHGALARTGAGVTIRWSAGGVPRRLRFEWRERGVPSEAGPLPRRGFGVELIEQVLAYDLDAETSLRLETDGLVCTIAVPLDGASVELTDTSLSRERSPG